MTRELALAAVLAFLPMRAGTLQALVHKGPGAHVWLHLSKRQVECAMPADIVKTGKTLTASIGRRGRCYPQAILSWWVSQARPHVMGPLQHPDHQKLFGGASYGRLANASKFSTARGSVFRQLHQARHAIATILMNQTNPRC